MNFLSLPTSVALFIVFAFLVIITICYIIQKSKLISKLKDSQKNIIAQCEKEIQNSFDDDKEIINTGSLIEKVWSQDRQLKSWESEYRACLSLPGMLLAVGLLGTFFGITINLMALSWKVVNSGASNISSEDLQEPLLGMAIAFISSLFGLAFNMGLTRFAPSHEITIKKDEVISNLENYIDNDYIPKLKKYKGHKSFHKAVEEFSNTLLTELPKTVASAVSLSLKQNIQEIRDVQKDFVDKIDNQVKALIAEAKEVYESIKDYSRFLEKSAEHFEKSAEHFRDAEQQASANMESGGNKFKNAVKQASASLGSATANLQAVQGQYSQSADSLSTSAQSLSASVQSIEDTMESLQSYAKDLKSLGTAVSDLNQRSQEILQLTQNNQQAFSPITDQLKQAVRDLENIANSVNQQLSNLTATLEAQVGSNSKELRDLAGQTKNLAQRINAALFSGSNKP